MPQLQPAFAVLIALCVPFLMSSLLGAQAAPQITFHVSVTGTFNSTTETCPYCNCFEEQGCSFYGSYNCSPWNTIGVDDAQMRWGDCVISPSGCTQECNYICNCFMQSGVGFMGSRNFTMSSNPPPSVGPSVIGVLTHYNNIIEMASNGILPTRIQLTLTMTAPELESSFKIHYPLYFFETPNDGADNLNSSYPTNTDQCDPSLQESHVPCDDRFTFPKGAAALVNQSFTYNNIQYTLQITGFVKYEGSSSTNQTTPVVFLTTPETKVTHAAIYGELITSCYDTSCANENQVFNTSNCRCECLLANDTCLDLYGPNWALDESTCSCVCNASAAEQVCPHGQTFNNESCSCGCVLTDTYCSSNNSLWTLQPDCTCGCRMDLELYCYRLHGPNWAAAGNYCGCACAITDSFCENTFGAKYAANKQTCGCIAPGSSGLSGGAIAGIVIGSVAGAAGLSFLFALGTLGLVKLITSGMIPGIYGYKLEPMLLDHVNDSPLYSSPWSNTNALSE